MRFYGGETRSRDFKPDRFGYTIDNVDVDIPAQDDKEGLAADEPEPTE